MVPIIMCVEDDDVARMICRIICAKENFSNNVLEMSNGKVAFDYLVSSLLENSGEVPNIIFLDVNMPVMNGWEFLDAIGDKFPDLSIIPPIYIMTSSDSPLDKKNAESNKLVNGYFFKPFSAETISFLSKEDCLKTFFQ